jgi:hypothetical protein
VSIRCPHCQNAITVKGAKPGRYTPKCPKCGGSFALTVTEGGEDRWVVEGPDVKPKAAPEPLPLPDDDKTDAIVARPRAPQNEELTAVHESAVTDNVEETLAGSPPGDEPPVPRRLGGYEVLREIGRGGMGAVYLARQVSLDRPVALKVMNSRWARDPVFLARFTREAYAAAQLVHHNVVQIYDIGADRGINFFSMEYVEGRSLGEVVKAEGRLDPQAAAGYTLQAARGLKFAHDRGMIHRDVKPDNLMLNTQGVVKVADLGLVKTATMTPADDAPSREQAAFDPRLTRSGLGSLPAGVTHAKTAMGSPAYMSPEQCRDAAAVDHRADVYSLGCSLYVLLTGRAPFQGSSSTDVMLKHATEAPVPPDRVAPGVPPELSAVVLKMLEKDPDRRYQGMAELIRDLERWLGLKEGVGFRPGEEQLGVLENCVERFNSAPAATMRNWMVRALVAAATVGILIGLFRSATLAVGMAALLTNAALAYFLAAGSSGKTHLFRAARDALLGSALSDWLMIVFCVGIFALLLSLTGFLWVWLGFGALGAIVALGTNFLIDKQVAAARRGPVEECERMFKRLRLRGGDEDALRRFIARNAGRHWEEFYEALFGFEAKLAARAELGAEAQGRAKYGTWREPVVRWLERVRRARREARERRLLQKIEAERLRAEGLDRREAEDRAEAAAAQMVEQAAEIQAARQEPDPNRTRADGADATVAAAKPVNVARMIRDAERTPKKRPKPPARPFKKLVEIAFNWKLRFVIGALLLAGGSMWVRQNLAATKEAAELEAGVSSAAGVRDVEQATEEAEKLLHVLKAILNSADSKWKPLHLSMVPDALTHPFDSVNPLAAGLALVVSIFFMGTVRVLLFVLAAAVMFAGHKLGLPEVGPLKPHQLALAVGGFLALVAILYRGRD